MRGDGDGWVVCTAGHRHWGRFGAAGLLLRYVPADGPASILLQHRAAFSHHGDTWGLPGGARDSQESAQQAALREAAEECSVDLEKVTVTGEWIDDHGIWSYTTVLAVAQSELEVSPANWESVAFRWVPEADVVGMPLHPGFAATWPELIGL
jgi:8-oxo-dGTP diphosphatase